MENETSAMNMEKANSEKSILRRCTDKIYGGLYMSWPVVIIYAVFTAIIAAVFLVVPIFENTSFERVGVTFEAWVFFAVIVMANCKSPIDSAVKTFVFFLVSQPLIYLFQVPFSYMGWQLFGYYGYWFKLTLLTFPAAFIGWYIKKKNWFSLLILLPVFGLLAEACYEGLKASMLSFPHLIVTAIFCALQIILYLYVFTESKAQKIAGFIIPVLLIAFMFIHKGKVEINGTDFLPEGIVLTENATVEVLGDKDIQVSIESTGKDPLLRVKAEKYGSTSITITDGDKQYHFKVKVFEDKNGYSRIEITED